MHIGIYAFLYVPMFPSGVFCRKEFHSDIPFLVWSAADEIFIIRRQGGQRRDVFCPKSAPCKGTPENVRWTFEWGKGQVSLSRSKGPERSEWVE